MMASKNRKLIFILFFVLSLFVADIFGNTSRDMGPEPTLDENQINNWILFYTNIERVKRDLTPLGYDENLNKAAKWHADYLNGIGTLSHYSNVTGMKTPKERIVKFAGNVNAAGENVIVEFTSNIANRRYYLRTDSQGKYKDYGNYKVYWFNERQLGQVMVKAWMNSPKHRDNILRRLFYSMGAGVAKGKYSGEKSYYGCQVFSGKKDPEFTMIKVQRIVGTTREYQIDYDGKYKVKVISLGENREIINHEINKKGNSFYYKKDKGIYFVSLLDEKNNILYPVKVIK